MKISLVIVVILFSINSFAQTCVGKWVTVDDETGKKKSIVELYKSNGKLYGKITFLYPKEGREDNPKCKLCTDDRKDLPLLGLQVVRGLVWDGSEWEDGTIVDPKDGKIYSLKMWLDEDNPDYLNVRGYIGPFYRTQKWFRTTN